MADSCPSKIRSNAICNDEKTVHKGNIDVSFTNIVLCVSRSNKNIPSPHEHWISRRYGHSLKISAKRALFTESAISENENAIGWKGLLPSFKSER